jgi:hypothetical protein
MRKAKRQWVAKVQSTSDAMDLEPGVFRKATAKEIAQSILRSVQQSNRKKGTTLSSGISMMTYYSNRAGRNLSPERKRLIQDAKEEYRKLVGAKGS